jgi:hypothetical protein
MFSYTLLLHPTKRSLKLAKELPSLPRRPRIGLSILPRRRRVLSIKHHPDHGLLATLIHRLHLGVAAARRIRRLALAGRAPVVPQEPVAHLAPAADGEHEVLRPVLAVVGHAAGAARAAADHGVARQRGDGAQLGPERARERVAHGAAVAEARAEAPVLVDAEVVFDGGDDGAEEGDVLAALVGPAVVEAVGDDEDGAGRVVDEVGQAVVGHVAALPGDDLGGVAAEGVEGEDEPVRVVVVVVGREPDEVLALLAVDGHAERGGGATAVDEARGLAAARGRADGDSRRCREREEGEDGGEEVHPCYGRLR